MFLKIEGFQIEIKEEKKSWDEIFMVKYFDIGKQPLKFKLLLIMTNLQMRVEFTRSRDWNLIHSIISE